MTDEQEYVNPFQAEELARGYDAFYETPLGATVDRLEKRLIYRLARPRAGETALDVGTGTGHWAIDLARKGLKVTGVDTSEAMLAVARQKSAAVAWQRGDAQALPFADYSFQLVLAVTTLEFVRDPQVALAEMARVTAPGGRMVVAVLNASSRWAHFYKAQAEKQETPFAHAHFFVPDEFVVLLSRWGKPTWSSAVFIPPTGRGLAAADIIEWLGQTGCHFVGPLFRCRHRGALLVGRVDR
ncbi:MAG: methyltransferase domain-containing protein [Chloroflexi bacterium]|nr:methyltransferase domain-containing protein [Chloroflexota bacterium]